MSLQGFFRRLKLSNLVLLMLALSNCCNVCFKAPKNSEDTGAIYKICSQLIIKNQINVNGCPMINYSSNFIILGYSVIKITPTRGYFLEIKKRKILSLSPSSPSPASIFHFNVSGVSIRTSIVGGKDFMLNWCCILFYHQSGL